MLPQLLPLQPLPQGWAPGTGGPLGAKPADLVGASPRCRAGEPQEQLRGPPPTSRLPALDLLAGSRAVSAAAPEPPGGGPSLAAGPHAPLAPPAVNSRAGATGSRRGASEDASGKLCSVSALTPSNLLPRRPPARPRAADLLTQGSLAAPAPSVCRGESPRPSWAPPDAAGKGSGEKTILLRQPWRCPALTLLSRGLGQTQCQLWSHTHPDAKAGEGDAPPVRTVSAVQPAWWGPSVSKHVLSPLRNDPHAGEGETEAWGSQSGGPCPLQKGERWAECHGVPPTNP